MESFKKEKEAYKQLGIKGEFLQKTPLGVDIKAAISMENQGIFHSVGFLNGVLEYGVKNGLKVYENTRIDKMEEEGESIVLKSKDGNEIKCKHVVFATHFPVIVKDDHYADV